VRCGDALVGVYVDYRVEDGTGFHSVAIIDLIISFCFIVDVEPFHGHCPFDILLTLRMYNVYIKFDVIHCMTLCVYCSPL
jgi:hypothetical protein